MQKAQAGQVWVDQSVQSKTQRFFEYKDLGSVQVKGKTESRHIYLALGANNLAAANCCLQEAINLLENKSGSGEYPPQNIWWVYAQICRAQGHHPEAERAWQRANALVLTKAEQISDPDLRRSYLENVRLNAAIVEQANQN
jgi:hypothetical protein